MALNFPLNPADGDTYEGYVYDATAGVWNSNPHQIASRFVTSATAPSSPSEGDGWFDTNTAKSYVYYDGVWVQLGALGTVDLNQIADVNVSSPANGESLVYDGTDWVNQNVSVDVYDVGTSSTGKFALPSGTTAERPVAPNAGDIRFNTETGRPEWYSADFSDWYEFHEFPSTTFNVEYLVIAGGGGGGFDASGGGGAGGYRSSVAGESSGGGASAESALTITGGISYNISIGAGGAGSVSGGVRGANGSNSLFSNIASTGGGGGGDASASAGSGGSGGGAYYNNSGAAASGIAGQGYAGGSGNNTATDAGFAGGGGGGAAEPGNTNFQAFGGDGIESSITGVPVFRAGGGGGARGSGFGSGGLGGNGGGGDGAKRYTGVNSAGEANTGGGGGGGDNQPTSVVGAAGGSGVVILKYPSSQNISPSVGLSYNTTTVGEYKVTEFTAGTGTVTFS